MCIDHSFDKRAHQTVERRGRILNEHGFYHAVNLLNMALMKRGEDGSLVREILIDRADTDTGDLCDTVCRYGISSLTLQDADNGFEDCVDGLTGAELLGLASMGCGGSSTHHDQISTNVSFRIYTIYERMISQQLISPYEASIQSLNMSLICSIVCELCSY